MLNLDRYLFLRQSMARQPSLPRPQLVPLSRATFLVKLLEIICGCVYTGRLCCPVREDLQSTRAGAEALMPQRISKGFWFSLTLVRSHGLVATRSGRARAVLQELGSTWRKPSSCISGLLLSLPRHGRQKDWALKLACEPDKPDPATCLI